MRRPTRPSHDDRRPQIGAADLVHGGHALRVTERARQSSPAPKRALAVVASVLCTVVLALVVPAPASAGTAPGTAGVAPAPAGPPAGTVGRAARYLTDTEGRVLLPHGVSLPAGSLPDPALMDRWVADGFTAVRLSAVIAPDGTFPGSGGVTVAGSPDPGLDELEVAARAFTDRGFRVVLRINPGDPGSVVTASALTAAVARMSARFAGAGGLVGYEIDPQPAAAGLGELFTAVRQSDPFHLLWWQDTTPLAPGARVARNDAAAYLVDWGEVTFEGVARLAGAAEVAHMGWFYDLPPTGVALPALTRPYPAAVAGIPLGFAAEDSGVFSLTYSTAPAGGGRFADGAATAVVLPAAAYPNGYRVQVLGARVSSAPGSGVLCLVAEPGAGQVQVRVEPAEPGTATPVLPAVSVTTCAAPPPASASATWQGQPAGAAGGDGQAGDDLALLVLFPLLGAVGMAVLLGGAVGLLRVRRPARPPRGADFSLP